MTDADGVSQFAEKDAVRIHYTAYGKGSPVILLHGGGPGANGISNFSRNIEALSARHRIYILDQIGFGKSSKNIDQDNPFLSSAKAIKIFMDAVGLEKADLVGNSFGASSALRLALIHPERVGKLVLMGPGGAFSPLVPTPTAGIVQLLTYYLGSGPSFEKLKSFIQHLVYDASSLTPELIRQRYEASIDPEVVAHPPLSIRNGKPPGGAAIWREEGLMHLPHKTLLIWGIEDRVNPFDGAFSLLKQIPNCELYALPKCGHWAQWEKPAEFHDAVLAFLARE